MNLVIVESSTKAKIIEKYLNTSTKLDGKFKVVASQGHIRDLAKKNMGVNTQTFDCTFDLIADKKRIANMLSKAIKDADFIYLAADNDREGEGIAWHIKTMFKVPDAKCKRLLFNEITKNAIEKSVINATTINLPVVQSYLSRRILDRLVGFMITKLLWKSFNSNVTLTAGRVQSATLNIILEKEYEVTNFKSSPYWTVKGDFGKGLTDTTLYYKDIIYKSTDHIDIKNKLKRYMKSKFSIKDAYSKNVSEKAPQPFTTSSLQQTSYSSLHLPIKMTMSIAQDLYEMGAITYMRTDSVYINPSFSVNAKTYIENKYGSPYVQTKLRKSKLSKNAQEAHEAIRPTCIEKSYKFKTKKHEELYELIWKRSIAYFMSDAAYTEIHVSIVSDADTDQYRFIGKERVLSFNGWMGLYGKESSTIDTSNIVKGYLQMVPKAASLYGHNIWTNPPSRYNESSIINKLEKSGIGRPSTYASIMSKLFEKQYIEKKDIIGSNKKHVDYAIHSTNKNDVIERIHSKVIGEETKRLVPTEIGVVVDGFVSTNFKNIVDVDFTSSMEDSLDDIANGTLDYKAFLNKFYSVFNKDFKEVASKLMPKDKKDVGKDEYILRSNKSDNVQYVKRTTRYGPVIEKRIPDKKSEYINLQAFLNDTDMKFSDIRFEDIELLLKLPLEIVHNGKDTYQLLYGRYGFYLKNVESKATFRVYKKNIKYVLNIDLEGLFSTTIYKKKS